MAGDIKNGDPMGPVWVASLAWAYLELGGRLPARKAWLRPNDLA